jgi:hypothetical protein
MNRIKKGLVVLCFSAAMIANAQTSSHDTTALFRVGLDFGGGYIYKLKATNKLPGEYTRCGLAGTFRLKWGKRELFGAGIETGWLPISSLTSAGASTDIGITDIEASLDAIPLLVIIGIQRYNIQLHSGLGYYRVKAKVRVFDVSTESSEWDFGYMLALGYIYPINSDLKFAVEIKWNNISEVQVSLLSIQARILVGLWKW